MKIAPRETMIAMATANNTTTATDSQNSERGTADPCEGLVGRKRDICRGHDADGRPLAMRPSVRAAYLDRWGVSTGNAQRTPEVHAAKSVHRVIDDRRATCRHLGQQLRVAVCKTCGRSGSPAPVFACGLHGECTLRNYGKAGVSRCCLTCTDFAPAERAASTWAVGITTAPRAVPTLEHTLATVRAAGWSPVVYAEPESPVPDDVPTVRRASKRGAWGNWLQTARQLLASDTSHVLILQDDVELAPDARAVVEAADWPADVGAVSLYTSAKYDRRRDGQHDLPTANFWGACALAFESSTLRRLLLTKTVMGWVGDRNIDTAIGRACAELGLRIVGWSPSLSQHVGDTSTLGTKPNDGNRVAARVRRPPEPRRPRLLWLLSDLARGGIASYVANVVPGLQDDHGVDSDVCWWNNCPQTNYDLARRLSRWAPLTCTHQKAVTPGFRAERPFVTFAPGQATYDRLIDAADVVTCASNNPDVLARTDWRGKPLIVQLHSTCAVTRKIVDTLRPHAAGWTVTSEAMRRWAIAECRLDPERITLIELAVDANRIASWEPQATIRERLLALGGTAGRCEDAAALPWVLFFGRFATEKRIGRIAEAVAELNRRGLPCFGVFAGDGWHWQKDADAIRATIPDRHLLLPWTPRVGDYLAASDVFVVASEFEGGPTTAIEALLAGVPVVSTPVGILPEIMLPVGPDGVPRRAALVTSADPSPGELAGAIETALSSDPTELALMAAQARGRFSTPRMVAQWADVVRLAMEARP